MADRKIKENLFTRLHSSFFWRFFSSYIILFLIPFFTIIVTYNYAAHSIEKSILRSNSNILYQFFSNVDAAFSEMSTIGKTLTNSTVVQQFAFRSKADMELPSVEAYYLNEAVNSFKQKEFENICIYFPEFSRVYNGRNGLALEDFYLTYYKDVATEEEYKNFLSESVTNYKTEIRSVNDHVLNPLLAVVFSQPASRSFHGAPGITAAITLSQDTLHQLFENSSVHSDGILMVFDGENKLLASSHPMSSDILSVYDGEKEMYYGTYQNQKYVLQFFPSQVSDCMYASAIPVNIFWEQLNNLRLTSFICILLCVLLSGFLAWKMTKVNYSPITGMIYTITETTGTVYDNKKNEMNFISDVLTSSFNEITTLTKKIELQEDTLRNNFLMHAMLGNAIEDAFDEERDIFLQHHIALNSDMFGIIYIFVEAVDESRLGDVREKQNQQILQFIIANVVQELCSEKHQGFLVPVAVNSYACIINFSGETSDSSRKADMQSVIKKSSAFLGQHFGIEITASLSGIHSNLPGIHKAYQEVTEAFTYRFLYGKGSIILFDDIQEKCFSFTGMEDNKIEYLLLSFIKDSSCMQDGRKIMEELKSQSGISSNSSLEAIACYKYDLLIRFSRVTHQIGAAQLPESNALHASVLAAGTFTEMQDCFINTLTALRQYYQDSQKNFTLCDQVETYLKNNFQNPELSNIMLGEVFHISHAYLSRMFKMQKNISIADFLYKLRIDHAKKMLETTDETLESIAITSGFLSSSTFIKVFKKSEGITPGTYRKLKQQ